MDKELKHFGVLGMKWGVRRYQPYPNGSKKKGREVGKAAKKKNPRYYTEDMIKEGKREDARAYKYNKSNEHGLKGLKRAATAKSSKKQPDVSKLSDQELRALINRQQMEMQYAKMNMTRTQKAKQWVAKNGDSVVVAIVTGIAIEGGKKFVKSKIGMS